ncbi:MAG: hypothetical protein V2I43_13960 [Parvularcula sp.]|nr:hypothetical protein [Parvularcula sp.]
MAEIPVKRKATWWPWILLVLALLVALLFWLTTAADHDDAVVDTTAELSDVPDPTTVANDALPAATVWEANYALGDAVENPTGIIGRDDFSGEVSVPSVPTDRGFWIEADGARLFAVLIDGPREVPVDINAGQELRVANGMLRDASFIADIPGEELEGDTLAILEDQDVYLVVHEDEIEISGR